MLFWILLPLAAIGAAAMAGSLMEGMWEDFTDCFLAFLTFIMGFLLLGCLAMGLMALAFIPAERHTDADKDTTEVLQAIQMGEGISGLFFLGSGVINEENVFTYYAKIESGSYRSGRIDAGAAEVVESDTETPRIVTHHFYWPRWIMPNYINDGMGFGGESYTVYVPKGSVKPIVDMSLPK